MTAEFSSRMFQYPRRIECGCGRRSLDIIRLKLEQFQYPRRIECGCGPLRSTLSYRNQTRFSILGGSSVGVAPRDPLWVPPYLRVSVSSADRVWVWPEEERQRLTLLLQFQYPRRIECGCGRMSRCHSSALPRVSVSSADRVWVWRA